MDINYLLVLQQWREGAGGILTQFFLKMSDIGEMNFVLIMAGLVYWSVNKEFGTYLLGGWSANRIVNGLCKVAACVYRPWIRDARIVPDAQAQATATGYSFPSGHAMNAASLYMGTALSRGTRSSLRLVCLAVAVLIGFSRNFLGVHTPQDVAVGLCAGILVMWLSLKVFAWVGRGDRRDLVVALVLVVVACAVAAYAALKPYPEDFDAAGNLLVDGHVMAGDTYKAVGWCLAFSVGWVTERRLVRFSSDGKIAERLSRALWGLLVYYLVTLVACPQIKAALPGPAGIICSTTLQMLYVVLLYPIVIAARQRRASRREAHGAGAPAHMRIAQDVA